MTRVQVELPVRFRDTDAMGHVNNAVYLSFLEECRIGYFAQRLEKRWDWLEKGVILARNEVNYRDPIFIQDRVYADVWVSRLGRTSFDFSYEVFAEGPSGKRMATQAKSVVVCYDFRTGIKHEIYPEWREIFAT